MPPLAENTTFPQNDEVGVRMLAVHLMNLKDINQNNVFTSYQVRMCVLLAKIHYCLAKNNIPNSARWPTSGLFHHTLTILRRAYIKEKTTNCEFW